MRGALVLAVLAVGSCPVGGGSTNGCPSVYDGTYNGIFQYEWEMDSGGGAPTTGKGEVRMSVTFACDQVTDTQALLSVVRASADDPYFGCMPPGCDPDQKLSLAFLPAKPPAVGTGKIAVYMKPGNYYTQGDVNVTGDGRIISSGPTGGTQTWYAFGGTTDFPDAQRLAVRWTRWTLSR